ncbi:MAG: hypothetical protein KDN20_09420 [Verrucomicrobiae bacterium]|nr:hypothetical protein [Verrucomicrobiae bacterium]
MKIQAIATLMTAAAVSFFQADRSSDGNNDSSAADGSNQISAIGESSWELVPTESQGIELFQQSASTFDDPLQAGPEGGFAAGGVVELAEKSGEEEVIDLEAQNMKVIDTVAPIRVDQGNSVNEIVSAEVEAEEVSEDVIDEALEVIPAETFVEATEVSEEPESDQVDFAKETGMDLVANEVEEESVEAAPEESRPAVPMVASSAPVDPNEESGGFADRLVNRVTEAVGGGSGDSEEEVADNGAPTMGEEDGGFWLRAARLNDVFQYLARLGHVQYFHNADLDAANYSVTGHLGDGDPVEQMEELGLMYGITIHRKGKTVYAMTEAQLAQLPTKPFYYQLKYLRPSDIEQIKGILLPILTAGSGSVDFEQKTNTLIFIDNEQKIERIEGILAELDKPKKQIAIETRILRIKSGSRNRIGVDWESVLGDGLTVSGTEALNTLFNLPDSDMVEQVITKTLSGNASSPFVVSDVGTADQLTTFGNITGTNDSEYLDVTERTISSTESQLVLSPLQLQATIRALNTGGLAQQESSPTLITEDNEAGIISIIDRVPIIVSTVSETTAGQNISDDVRYSIDASDPTASDDPTNSREIGVTVSVTPTILPDGTIRMALRPRSAQIVEFIQSRSGNSYPRVNESTVDTIARIPNGYSLMIGGFYEENESDETKKVPVLGDIPGLNFMFKSTDTVKEHTSLVFVVTPKLYDPVIIEELDSVNREIHDSHVLPKDHNWPDRKSPGDNYEPHLGWTLGNAVNAYPPTPPSNPLHPDHPVNLPEWDVHDEPGIRQGETMVEPVVDRGSGRKGLFGNLFKKRQR